MIYSYSHPVSDGIYFYIRINATPLTNFEIIKFSACTEITPVAPGVATQPTNVSGITFDTSLTSNNYDAEHFHLQPVAGSHRFIANSGATPTPAG